MTSSIDDEILGEDATEQEDGPQSSPPDDAKPPPYKSFRYVASSIQLFPSYLILYVNFQKCAWLYYIDTSSTTCPFGVLRIQQFKPAHNLLLWLARSSTNMSSYRKKYRKMRINFDEAMRQSNSLFMEEQLADETAKKMIRENELVKLSIYF